MANIVKYKLDQNGLIVLKDCKSISDYYDGSKVNRIYTMMKTPEQAKVTKNTIASILESAFLFIGDQPEANTLRMYTEFLVNDKRFTYECLEFFKMVLFKGIKGGYGQFYKLSVRSIFEWMEKERANYASEGEIKEYEDHKSDYKALKSFKSKEDVNKWHEEEKRLAQELAKEVGNKKEHTKKTKEESYNNLVKSGLLTPEQQKELLKKANKK